MKSEKLAMIMIINAILWATAMIASSIVLSGTGYYEKVSYILIALWFGSSLMLQDTQ